MGEFSFGIWLNWGGCIVGGWKMWSEFLLVLVFEVVLIKYRRLGWCVENGYVDGKVLGGG